MPWSIFQQGGGEGAAVTWAQDLQTSLGIPVNQADTQFIYDWEQSEGGGGAYNPLNQGPVPGHPELTSTGSQYGGGAADFVSWQAGLQGAVDYIQMPAYTGVLEGLKNQDYQGAASALWNSGWAASHYGYGSEWNTSTPPGATPLPVNPVNLTGSGGTTQTGNGGSSTPQSSGAWSLLGISDPVDIIERLGLILLGAALVLLGIYLIAGRQVLAITPLGKIAGGAERRAKPDLKERKAQLDAKSS